MERILFVDDEARVLEGLQRMLRGLRHEWEMHFVGNGQDGLALLDEATEPFDVLVTDMRMPGMDGAELLNLVRERHPGVVRIILSGHAELGLAMRSASCAHQFLSKPCDAEYLRGVIKRSIQLHQSLANERLKDVVGKLSDLPALPATYAELNAAMANEEVSILEVAGIVERDTGVAAKVLQLVNSSFFGIPRRVDSLRDAVSYIGLANLKTLVLQYGMLHEFDASTAAPSFNIEHHQQRSMNLGNMARRIHEHDRKLSDQTFLAGILHDIGRLVLATNMPDLYERVERLRATGRVPVHQLESRAIGVSHADIGAYLLGLWGMPDPIVETALRHHQPSNPDAGETFDSLTAVHVADALLDEVTEPGKPSQLDTSYLQRLGLESRVPEWRDLALQVCAGTAEDNQAA
jgi:HD-like signal output (HDOD) protein